MVCAVLDCASMTCVSSFVTMHMIRCALHQNLLERSVGPSLHNPTAANVSVAPPAVLWPRQDLLHLCSCVMHAEKTQELIQL